MGKQIVQIRRVIGVLLNYTVFHRILVARAIATIRLSERLSKPNGLRLEVLNNRDTLDRGMVFLPVRVRSLQNWHSVPESGAAIGHGAATIEVT